MRRTSILILFFLTGISGLIYQVAWVRQATLVFGVSVYAYSVVLAAFMGGLALGSYWLGRRADNTSTPLRLFARLQIGIAIFGALSPFLLTGLMPLYASIARGLTAGSPLIIGVRALFSMLILTPPTLLMGATLPVLARAVVTQGRRIGSDVGQLYAADTLGAALGCALTGLFLLRLLGTRETILLAAALNLLAALLALFLLPRLSESAAPAPSRRRAQTKKAKTVVSTTSANQTGPLTRRFILWAYALSGFAALGYEVAWARVLAIFTLDAVYSFAIMLTTFLTGITLGGWICAWWFRQKNRRMTLTNFVDLQIALGIAALITLFLFARLPRLNMEAMFGAYTLRNAIYYEFLLGFITLLLPTIMLGALFPVAIGLYTQSDEETLRPDLATQIGRLTALNTAGGVVGSLFVGFAMIPLAGLQATGAILACLNLIIGLVASWFARAQGEASSYLPQIGIAAGVALIMLLPDKHYLGFREGATDQMIFYQEGIESTVAVFEVPDQNFKVSFVNGRIEVPTDEISMQAFRLLGHLPAILNPKAQRALMLSFGNGIATGSLDTHAIPHIDAVDLAAEQFNAAELYWEENYNVLRSPRLHTYVEDGRNFLLQTPFQYDIITTDATHPVNTSSWALFTQEFYESVADHLTAEGVFLQWLPFHNLVEPDYKRILRTFQSVFPHATLWYTGGTHTLLLATPERLTPERLNALLQAGAQNTIVLDDLGEPASIAKEMVMDEDALRAYAGEGPLTTDDNAYFLPQDDDNLRMLKMLQALASPE